MHIIFLFQQKSMKIFLSLLYTTYYNVALWVRTSYVLLRVYVYVLVLLRGMS